MGLSDDIDNAVSGGSMTQEAADANLAMVETALAIAKKAEKAASEHEEDDLK